MSSDRIRRQIKARLSLRSPQADSLDILADIVEHSPLAEMAPFEKIEDPAAMFAAAQARYPEVTDFERDFPSLCFAPATGVGKTRLRLARGDAVRSCARYRRRGGSTCEAGAGPVDRRLSGAHDQGQERAVRCALGREPTVAGRPRNVEATIPGDGRRYRGRPCGLRYVDQAGIWRWCRQPPCDRAG